MLLKLNRTTFSNRSTIGELSIDGSFECYTLEDVSREKKIKHETAIPAGRYKVIVTRSARFQVDLPRLVDVPGYEGVLIHPGNSAKDTSGCILPGSSRGTDFVGNSRLAFDRLFPKIKSALARQETVEIEITGGY